MSESPEATNTPRLLGLISPTRDDTTSTPQSMISFREEISEEDFFNRVIINILRINQSFHRAIQHWLISHGIMKLMGLIEGYYDAWHMISSMGHYKDPKGKDASLTIHVLTRLQLIVSWAADWIFTNH